MVDNQERVMMVRVRYMMTRISFLIPIGEKVKQCQGMRRLRAHFRATDNAAPRVMPYSMYCNCNSTENTVHLIGNIE